MNENIIRRAQTNAHIVTVYEDMLHEYNIEDCAYKPLRSCKARVWQTSNYYILESYETFVACIDKKTHCCYDFLRYAYGYTATSAQHIAKFRRDYDAVYSMTYYD